MASQREEKDKRYKFGNSNIQNFPTAKGYQRQGPNSQRQPTLSQKLPVSLISPLPCHRNLQPPPLASIPQQSTSPLLYSNVPAPPSRPSASIPQKLRLLFCLQTWLLLFFGLQHQLLSNVRLLLCIQTCLLLWLSLVTFLEFASRIGFDRKVSC